MVLGFRYTHDWHRGSVLPRIATQRSGSGVRLAAELVGWGQALGFWFLLLFVLGMILLVAAFATDVARKVEAIVSMIVGGGALVEMGRRYFRQRRLQSASLIVQAWPLRLGQRVKVKFEKRLKAGATADGFLARLTCTEEAILSSGRDQKIRHATRYEMALDTSRARIQGRRIIDEWEIAIPAEGIPSFSVKSNKIQWRVETITESGGVGVSADFELLVVPEVVR